MGQPGWHGWRVSAPQHWHGAAYSTRTLVEYGVAHVVPVLAVLPGWRLLEGLRRLRVSGPTRFEDGEPWHVSMVHVPFGPWQLIRAYSQRDV